MTRVYAPDHPLGSAAAKLERAEVHIVELDRSIRNVSEPDISIVRRGHLTGGHPLGGQVVDDVRIQPRDGTEWSVIVGDIVTNLRSAFDHIAWALAEEFARQQRRTLTTEEERGISFPLGNNSDAFAISKLILPEAKSVIESFQPYNRTNRHELELLGILDELSRIDKHRFVIVLERLVLLRVNSRHSKTIRQRLDSPYHEWIISPPDVAEDFEPEGTYDIVMYPSLRPRGFSALEFREMHDFIRDEAIPAFARFFP